ncbi:hypothetical protein SAMN05421798_1318 [Pseudovibrio axinellae]|nr:hypothetical protein SAMN05421798_1318 [Pseudovibrio axinellae]
MKQTNSRLDCLGKNVSDIRLVAGVVNSLQHPPAAHNSSCSVIGADPLIKYVYLSEQTRPPLFTKGSCITFDNRSFETWLCNVF